MNNTTVHIEIKVCTKSRSSRRATYKQSSLLTVFSTYFVLSPFTAHCQPFIALYPVLCQWSLSMKKSRPAV